MGSLLIIPFSCTQKPTLHLQINMKVFATLATLLGASTATPLFQNQLHGSNDMRLNQHSIQSVMKPSMGMSMESRMSPHDNVDRRMDMNRDMSNMRNIYRDNQNMDSSMMGQEMKLSMMGRNMMGQEMRSNMRDMHRQNQAIVPNQYMVKDDFGNYVYSYNDQQSEKSEEGNAESIKGQYAYIMANGVKRRVEYVADNNGFHVRDNADPARIKRSTEPDLLQTRMTSIMDSASLTDDARDMYRMSNSMGRDMTSIMDRNMRERQMYSNTMGRESFNHNMMGQGTMGRNRIGQDSMGGNMIGQDTMGRNMIGQDTMGRNLMGRNIYSVMSNRGMTSDVSNMMGQQMNSNIMGRDMTMMSRNMMGQDRNSQMMGHNMVGHQEMTPNNMYSNMIGQDRMNMSNNRVSSNMMNNRGLSSEMMNSHSKNGLMGQRMMQKMELERVPETYTSTRFF